MLTADRTLDITEGTATTPTANEWYDPDSACYPAAFDDPTADDRRPRPETERLSMDRASAVAWGLTPR